MLICNSSTVHKILVTEIFIAAHLFAVYQKSTTMANASTREWMYTALHDNASLFKKALSIS